GWTGVTAHNKPAIDAYIPSPCGSGPTSTVINVGDSIDTSNGTVMAAWMDLKCWLCGPPQHLGPYLLPVIDKPCDTNFTGPMTVKGFATVTIDASYCAAGHDITDVPMQSMRVTDRPGGVGNCPHCGTGFIRLIG